MRIRLDVLCLCKGTQKKPFRVKDACSGPQGPICKFEGLAFLSRLNCVHNLGIFKRVTVHSQAVSGGDCNVYQRLSISVMLSWMTQ